MAYDHKKIEKKWQECWDKEKLYKTPKPTSGAKKRYVLDMFPYPSGAGLHVGHPLGYTATDIYSRYLRANGYQVLHPMGWDAFGLPAENYAIKAGVHPAKSTQKNIKNFRRQIKSLGLSYDWEREISTADPQYYKFTQWLFLQLFKRGLAYKKKAPVNWCSSCKTVLAREQASDGRCERCKTLVIQKDLEQWFFKITSYAPRLLKGLKTLAWSDSLKQIQKNWIGRSPGLTIKFALTEFKQTIEVFTTRPDTIFGATYLVLAPEHKLVSKLVKKATNGATIADYQKLTGQKTTLERTDLNKTKTGVIIGGIEAVNPANNAKITLVVADYVLADYGTGAVMAVPAHDERDFEFAKKFNLPIKEVVRPPKKTSLKSLKRAYTKPGILVNSGKYTGLESMEAGKRIARDFAKRGVGKDSVQYKLRDWLISRQRYWGAPIPIIYCKNCGTVGVPESDLPVKLPKDVQFNPEGKSPLAKAKKFLNTTCPQCKKKARRETDTMDTFVDSSWYMFRFADPHNQKEFARKKALEQWLPVDIYVGGAEHAVLHLLYARFITMFLQDAGYLNFSEPFLKLYNQGLVLAPDGKKMSKSLGNVINPDEIVRDWGADALRMYMMFMGPLQDTKPWNTAGIAGVRRFLEKVYRGFEKVSAQKKLEPDLAQLVSDLARKVGKAIEGFRFNTAVSDLMKFRNKLDKFPTISKDVWSSFLIVLNPFAPHLAQELWEKTGNTESITLASWNSAILRKTSLKKFINLPVQLNGKLLAVIKVSRDAPLKKVKSSARKNPKLASALAKNPNPKIIYRKGKIINFVSQKR